MRVWAQLRRGLQFLMLATLLYAAWVLASRRSAERHWLAGHSPAPPAANPEFDRVYGGSAVKILQFYARDGTLTEGDRSVICYGVLNAKSVRIEPPPEDGVFVALNRCVGAAPEHDTQYTLTAVGDDGAAVSASFVLAVHPDRAALPRITSFEIVNRTIDYRQRAVFLLSFSDQNAETVDIDPPAFPTLHGAPNGRFYVAPEKTTTYTLIVRGKHGHEARRQLTVSVK